MIAIGGWVITIAIARISTRSWLSPAAVLALSIGAASILQRVLAPEYYASDSATLLLMAFVWIAVVASVAGASVANLGIAQPTASLFVVERTGVLLAIGYVASCAYLLVTLRTLGASFASVADPTQIAAIAQSATLARYDAGLDFPLLYNVANATFLAYAIVATAHSVSSGKLAMRLLGPLVPFVLANMLVTTRAPLLFVAALAFFAAVFVSTRTESTVTSRLRMSRKAVTICVFVSCGLLALLVYFQSLRFGTGSSRGLTDMWLHLRRWPLGSVSAFALWVDGAAVMPEPRPAGFYTFMGIFDNLGISPRQMGGYADYVYLTPIEPDNVFTAFRGLIHDFGLAGTAAFIAITSFVAAMAWQGAFPPRIGLAVFVGTYGFLAWAVFVSMWAFTSTILAFAVAPFLLSVLGVRAAKAGCSA